MKAYASILRKCGCAKVNQRNKDDRKTTTFHIPEYLYKNQFTYDAGRHLKQNNNIKLKCNFVMHF